MNQPSLFGDIEQSVPERKIIQNATILCLDIATKTGWCLGNESGEFYSGVWNFTAKSSESIDVRIWKLMEKITAIFENQKIAYVFYELPLIYRSKKRRPNFASYEMIGVMKLICMEFRVKCDGRQSAIIKKFATGNGSADKDKMIAACKKKYGFIPTDHNEADAVHLYNMIYAEKRS